MSEKLILKENAEYSLYQQDLAFQKELNILRNDYYYQMIQAKCTSLVDFLYKPLDILSGDAYSLRKIDDNTTFYLIVDGMGKGVSASLTSMLITSYINHIIDKTLKSNSFDLHYLISESIEYIRPILLEEESLSVDYILLNTDENVMHYAKFAMPALLMQTMNHEIIRLKSNNPPISKYQESFTISEASTSDIRKFLFYSDGLSESSTIDSQNVYASFIEEDFLDSFTKEDFTNKIFSKITAQEDDITFIFINKTSCTHNLVASRRFETALKNNDIANEWYTEEWNNLTDNAKSIYSAGVVFTELFMNAYEHGNLNINTQTKHQLLENDTYFETLQNKEKGCTKKITVALHKVNYNSSTYIITKICDEGDGFDTQILSKIFRNSHNFNGRGVFVSRQLSQGIYYNAKGNTVLYINKI
ncbi:MAG: SpoIIE family protein phosphatase [Sulfurimonas sp.]|jgi:hypothetical protein